MLSLKLNLINMLWWLPFSYVSVFSHPSQMLLMSQFRATFWIYYSARQYKRSMWVSSAKMKQQFARNIYSHITYVFRILYLWICFQFSPLCHARICLSSPTPLTSKNVPYVEQNSPRSRAILAARLHTLILYVFIIFSPHLAVGSEAMFAY